MTVCNMSIEGGARCGYVNPDQTTFDYLRGRPLAPERRGLRRARWSGGSGMASDAGAALRRRGDASTRRDLPPAVTWGINPGQAIGVDERIPAVEDLPPATSATVAEDATRTWTRSRARRSPGRRSTSPSSARCTNGRLSDLREAARHLPRPASVAPAREGARRCPARSRSRARRRREGLDEIFRAAGFEWRAPGCSMCLAMNPDKLVGRQLCASSSQPQLQGPPGQPDGPHRC